MSKKIEQITAAIAKLEKELEELRASLDSEESKPEELPVWVNISDRSYSLSETAITVGQWNTYAREAGLQEDNLNPNFPKVNVSWNEANAYCEWLGRKLGKTVRLPSEDEWEHSCADHQTANQEIAVYEQSSICEVKTTKPNKHGLYGMLGLVWEWTSSRY